MDSGQQAGSGIRFAKADWAVYHLPMSTLAEIEQAAEVLPVEQPRQQRRSAAVSFEEFAHRDEARARPTRRDE